MFGLGTWELVVVMIVLLLLFGSRLPSVMRSLGKSVTEFKKGMNDVTEEVTSAKPAHGVEKRDEKPSDTTPAG